MKHKLLAKEKYRFAIREISLAVHTRVANSEGGQELLDPIIHPEYVRYACTHIHSTDS